MSAALWKEERIMLRIFCSTNRCGYLAQAGSRDRAALAEARRERDAALAEARESMEFYFDLFCLERARQGAGR